MQIDESTYKAMPAGLQRLFLRVPNPGSDEVLALFPDSNGSGGSLPNVKITGYGGGAVGTGKSEYFGGPRTPHDSGSGSAARFFYCAKASKKGRDEGMEGEPGKILARSCQAEAEAVRDRVRRAGMAVYVGPALAEVVVGLR